MKAPRGPIKAQHPIDGLNPMERAKCRATNRQGKRCGKFPIPGGVVCRMHGGAAPQVKAAAEKRLADLVPKAVEYYDWLLSQRDFPSAGLGAANAVWDREKGKPREQVSLEHSGGIVISHEVPE